MAYAYTKTVFNTSADILWQMLGDFNAACVYLFMVERCSVEGAGIGAVRTLISVDGSTIIERLEALNEADRSLSYALLSDTPFLDCLTTINVLAVSPGECLVTWSATFRPDGLPANEAIELLEGVFKLNNQALQRYIETHAL